MQFNESKKQPVLLAVLAHPDDESFGIGGTLAYYARNGVHIELVCATKGEAGEMDEKFLHANQTSADVRIQELRCAAGILGISNIHFLDYRDSGMSGSLDNQNPQALCNQSVDQVAAEVADIIRKVQPNIVITFDPIGGYRHPDHIAIHHAAVAAYQMTSDPGFVGNGLATFQPDRLIYSTFPKTMMRLMISVMKLIGKDPTRFGQNEDIDLASIAEVTFPIHYKIDYRSVEKERDAASACHASQGGAGLSGGFLGFFRRILTPYETFMQAVPEFTEQKPKKDLFYGLS
ncbi:MAG: PIG-L family deacetylase [Anaerolineaceae bacterium]|nr:PIG-L family deacetylase [Anaerolineaceae bacterium]